MFYRLRAVVVTGLALGLAAFAAVPAVGAPTQHEQKLQLSGDPHVTGSNSLALKAKKIPSGALVEACFTFRFTGDLLDLGEGLTLAPKGQEGPGFFNPSSEPISSRTMCVNNDNAPDFIAAIEQGSAEKFIVKADPSTSTFTVSSVRMILTYA
ncbi:hypothetical protein [Arthrobacter sp. AFG20]|uniref:hypothetical protein n=1 Tax=Arthrobacter sp. AFG20 TaxID=1688671 RepID=UPI000C9E8E7B|nr:hypothetical protein [Arthrobacter sp. AFG20]PNH85263.1 hypothetical protein CXZ05_07035 [Arthrobacter sp. AFG20]